MDNGLPFLKKQIRKTQVLLEDTQTLKHEVQKISQSEDSFSLVELNYFIKECAHSLFILLTSYKDIKGIQPQELFKQEIEIYKAHNETFFEVERG